jgi:hypothetical protein
MRVSVELVERLRAARLVNAADRRTPVIDAGGQATSAPRPVLREVCNPPQGPFPQQLSAFRPPLQAASVSEQRNGSEQWRADVAGNRKPPALKPAAKRVGGEMHKPAQPQVQAPKNPEPIPSQILRPGPSQIQRPLSSLSAAVGNNSAGGVVPALVAPSAQVPRDNPPPPRASSGTVPQLSSRPVAQHSSGPVPRHSSGPVPRPSSGPVPRPSSGTVPRPLRAEEEEGGLSTILEATEPLSLHLRNNSSSTTASTLSENLTTYRLAIRISFCFFVYI